MRATPNVDEAVLQNLRELIAVGSRVLARFELVDYLGHVSARVPGSDHALIRARGAEQGDQQRMRPDQVVLVDLEGEPVTDGGSAGAYRPPDETRLHTELYKARPDVQAIVHTHQPIATVFGDVERPILPMQGVMASVVRDEIPIYRSARKVTTAEQGVEVARVLGDATVLHMQNHGVTIVGTRVEQVVIDAIWLEHQAKLTLWASMLGTPRGMRREELELQAGDAFGIEGRWRYYASLVE
jgi:ribulose-5-phosphate 4-epimerase/fuculose-1-phosphate aldolase